MFDGVYTGGRLLIKGPIPPCPVKEDVSVTISDGTLSFTDSASRAGRDVQHNRHIVGTMVVCAGAFLANA
jgi:hypothetical protein